MVLALLLGTVVSSVTFGRDKHPTSACDKPRDIASKPQFSKEQSARARELKVQGRIDISIDDDGDVTEAKVEQLYLSEKRNTKEAADLLIAFAKSAKFRPRTGCGVTHTTINFTWTGG